MAQRLSTIAGGTDARPAPQSLVSNNGNRRVALCGRSGGRLTGTPIRRPPGERGFRSLSCQRRSSQGRPDFHAGGVGFHGHLPETDHKVGSRPETIFRQSSAAM